VIDESAIIPVKKNLRTLAIQFAALSVLKLVPALLGAPTMMRLVPTPGMSTLISVSPDVVESLITYSFEDGVVAPTPSTNEKDVLTPVSGKVVVNPRRIRKHK
jgi:hypothetical protein